MPRNQLHFDLCLLSIWPWHMFTYRHFLSVHYFFVRICFEFLYGITVICVACYTKRVYKKNQALQLHTCCSAVLNKASLCIRSSGLLVFCLQSSGIFGIFDGIFILNDFLSVLNRNQILFLSSLTVSTINCLLK